MATTEAPITIKIELSDEAKEALEDIRRLERQLKEALRNLAFVKPYTPPQPPYQPWWQDPPFWQSPVTEEGYYSTGANGETVRVYNISDV